MPLARSPTRPSQSQPQQRPTTPTGTMKRSKARKRLPISQDTYIQPPIDTPSQTSTDTQETSIIEETDKPCTTEAYIYLSKAKEELDSQRNIKKETKNITIEYINKLYYIIEELENRLKYANEKLQDQQNQIFNKPMTEQTLRITNTNIKDLVQNIDRHTRYLEQHAIAIEKIKTEMAEICTTTTTPTAPPRTYAEAVITQIPPQSHNIPLRPHHSLIISSQNTIDTSDIVLNKVRTALNARSSGIKIQSVRKIREQRIILSCSTQEEAETIENKLSSSQQFKIEKAKNKNPQIILKNVFNYNTDNDIIDSIKEQNKELIENIPDEQLNNMVIKYKRKTKNPIQNHVIMQVPPEIWQSLTRAGYVHIDLQRIRVEDQTPSFNVPVV